MSMRIAIMDGELITALEAAACRAQSDADGLPLGASRDLLEHERQIILEHVAQLKAAEQMMFVEMEADEASQTGHLH